MTVRLAAAADATDIAAIWNPMIRDTAVTFNPTEKTPAEVAAMIAGREMDGHCTLVAEADGAVLGFASYAQFRAGAGYRHTMEHTVILAPCAQGRGLGRALLRGLEDHARAAGGHSLIGGVSSGNPEGLRFHARCGYAEIAVLLQVGRKFGRWYDLHLMQKML